MKVFETTRSWVIFTIFISIVALVVHFSGMTDGFRHPPFEEPIWYHTWPSEKAPRFDEITHPLSACAVTAIVLNFNLPMSYKKKWIISLIIGMIFGSIWEFVEFISVAFIDWMKISPTDTLLDFHQDFYGSVLAVLLYTITMRVKESVRPARSKYRLI